MSNNESVIKGLFNRLNDLKSQKKYYQQEKDYFESMRLVNRIEAIRNALKKEMSL